MTPDIRAAVKRAYLTGVEDGKRLVIQEVNGSPIIVGTVAENGSVHVQTINSVLQRLDGVRQHLRKGELYKAEASLEAVMKAMGDISE